MERDYRCAMCNHVTRSHDGHLFCPACGSGSVWVDGELPTTLAGGWPLGRFPFMLEIYNPAIGVAEYSFKRTWTARLFARVFGVSPWAGTCTCDSERLTGNGFCWHVRSAYRC